MSDPAVGYTSGDARKAAKLGDEMSGPLAWTGAADSHAIEAKVTGDSVDRFAVEVDGSMEWGGGSGARDTNLYRASANVLKTDDTFQVGASNTILLGAAGDTAIERTGTDEITVNNLIVTGTFTGDVDTVIPADIDCTTLDATGAITAGTSVTAADLVATDDLTVGDDATITGSLSAADITATTTVTAADLVATDDLTVGDDATITGDLTAANLTASAAVQGADLIATDDLTVGDDASVTGDLTAGTITTAGALSAASATVSGALTAGSATCTGTLTIGADTNLYRSAANVLKTDDSLSVAGTEILIGADVNLYRSAADTLKTDDSLLVAVNITANGDITAGDDLTVTDDASIGGDLAVTGMLTVGGIGHITPPMPTSAHYVATSGQSATTTSATTGNQTLRAFPFIVTESRTCTKLAAEVTSAGESGSKVRLGIYNDNGHLYPGTLLVDGGTINGDSATVQEVTISQVLTPGVYWFVSAVQLAASSQPTMRCPSTSHSCPIPIGMGTSLPASNAQAFGYQQTSIGNGALPGTFTSTVTTSSSGARVIAKLT